MIRFATKEDVGMLLRIYSQYIDTAISFEYALPTKEEFLQRIENIKRTYPYLVYEENDCIIGYAYANKYRDRDAYQWDAELSVYIDQTCTSKGVGHQLYESLIEMLKIQGVKTVYGLVTVPNKRSAKLHQSFGFTLVGTHVNTGYKCGKWQSVAIFEKGIAEYNIEPDPIIPICQVAEEELFAILSGQ